MKSMISSYVQPSSVWRNLIPGSAFASPTSEYFYSPCGYGVSAITPDTKWIVWSNLDPSFNSETESMRPSGFTRINHMAEELNQNSELLTPTCSNFKTLHHKALNYYNAANTSIPLFGHCNSYTGHMCADDYCHIGNNSFPQWRTLNKAFRKRQSGENSQSTMNATEDRISPPIHHRIHTNMSCHRTTIKEKSRITNKNSVENKTDESILALSERSTPQEVSECENKTRDVFEDGISPETSKNLINEVNESYDASESSTSAEKQHQVCNITPYLKFGVRAILAKENPKPSTSKFFVVLNLHKDVLMRQ